jgi:predicted PurR-regulated permease PerM
MSILDSLYAIVKGNLNLLITILYAVISTIFTSGFALMNFLFSFVVYITASFYLLSSSDSRYEPFQLMTDIKIFKSNEQEQSNTQQQHQTTRNFSRSQMLIRAIEDSIRSVFLVSFKMALFYGVYTYLINCLFGVSIIYLTSIIAAFLAFLPLLGTYWVSLPGVLELWLIQNKPIYAIFYFFMHLLPLIISVDKAIYSEIKVGHPYMSSLAFAGGVYCLGLEGAIIGPIVLCLFIVIGKMLSNPTTITKSKAVIN